jgi:hypothetical protein
MPQLIFSYLALYITSTNQNNEQPVTGDGRGERVLGDWKNELLFDVPHVDPQIVCLSLYMN